MLRNLLLWAAVILLALAYILPEFKDALVEKAQDVTTETKEMVEDRAENVKDAIKGD
jgi:hypothetical protein